MVLEKLFKPHSVAVIGASHQPHSIGAEIVRNLLSGPFQGPIYPVNPTRPWINGIKAYKSVLEIPDPVDLAILCVPKQFVLGVIDECGRKGVGGAVIITAGFKEAGGAGIELEKQLQETLRKYSIRAIGPNCMGMIVTDPAVKLNGSFGAVAAAEGNIAFLSQSGALGEAILALAKSMGLGMSAFVSLGNRVDVSVNDLLEHWTKDPATDVILMYIESFGNMTKFPAIAAAATRKKPVLAVKSGRTAEGARAASSHTGSLAGRDIAADALFEKTGILRANTLEELFSMATAFSRQPLPKGNSIAVVTNAGGPGILATDVLISGGMKLAKLSDATNGALRKVLPAEASIANPVDMIASAGPPQYEATVKTVLQDENVAALIVIFVSPVTIDSFAVAEAIARSLKAADRPDKPVLICFMGKVADEEGTRYLKAQGFPVYVFPEAPAHALIAMDKLRRFRERPAGTIAEISADLPRARAALAAARARGGGWLNGDELSELLQSFGIKTLPQRTCGSADEAAAAATALGFPVVMKVDSAAIVHKSEVKGVILNLKSPMEVKGAFHELSERVQKITADYRITLQPFARGGREVIAGFSSEPEFGKLLMVGMGGIYVEVIKDVAVRLAPVTDVEAAEMIESLRAAPLLRGYRGEAPADIPALRDLLLRLSQLARDIPELETLEINPVLVKNEKEGLVVLDARAKLS
jgi:acetyltransferase